MAAALPNIRLVRRVRSEHGAILRTEVGGSWFSHAFPAKYFLSQLEIARAEEPNAGWTLECHGTENGWHTWDGTSA